ncbi:hypothetical protein GCM10010492_04300 [Saccharothrix mutabilis subsp. mutabilis]|uniref:Uncharacterized protein n=1 Tax=Saccharothrix mutabilis subsp. mutabilis TaxID=66855 RepID=A0ABN0T1P4_9PSEU
MDLVDAAGLDDRAVGGAGHDVLCAVVHDPECPSQGWASDNEAVTARSRTGIGTYAPVSTAHRRSGFEANARTYDEVTNP